MTSLLKHYWAGSSDIDILYSSNCMDSIWNTVPIQRDIIGINEDIHVSQRESKNYMYFCVCITVCYLKCFLINAFFHVLWHCHAVQVMAEQSEHNYRDRKKSQSQTVMWRSVNLTLSDILWCRSTHPVHQSASIVSCQFFLAFMLNRNVYLWHYMQHVLSVDCWE